MIISIDGPAGSGKSTVAKKLSEKLNFIHFNSGSLYRAITAHLMKNNFNINEILESTPVFELNLEIKFIDGIQNVFVNNINYTNDLRNNEVSNLTPVISTNKSIRKLVDTCQKDFCSKNNVVIDGRDIGSFVFPNAEVKFYLDCDLKERAKRRYLEEKQKNSKITLKSIEKEIEQRDFIDKTKKIAPLIVPNNAIIINSTHLTINEVVEKMFEISKEKTH